MLLAAVACAAVSAGAANGAAAASLPNDPSFGQQWALRNTGQVVGGIAGMPGADEDVLSAWSVTTGSRNVVVAVADTGIDANHPDLAANVWTNPGGVGGCSQGTHGFDVVGGESPCAAPDTDSSYSGHGTHVAGIVGAVGNNGTGVVGVNWQTTVLPVKWLDDAGSSGSTSNLVAALQKILSLRQAGVNIRVVNVSPTWKGTARSQQLADAINALGQAGILFVTAAGNTAENNDAIARYPCDYQAANELCVTMTDQTDHLDPRANWGPTTVDLAAPGSRIYSTLPVARGSYGFISGGSMAAAEVSGAAALLLAQNPSLSVGALKSALLNNVRPLASLSGKVRTGGILDICAALPGCVAGSTLPLNTSPPAISGLAQAGQSLTATTGSWQNSPTSFAYRWLRCDTSGSSCAPTGTIASAYAVTAADVGYTLEVVVTATNPSGSADASSSPTATVTQAQSGGVLGRAAKGSVLDSGYQGYKAATPYAMPAGRSGVVQSLSIWVSIGSSPVRARAMIYADAGGRPGALLDHSADQTVSAGSSQHVTFALSGNLTLQAGGTYWLAVGFDGGGGSVSVWSEPNGNGVHVYTANPAAADPFGSPTTAHSAGDVDESVAYADAALQPPANTSPPTIGGVAQSGKQLSATTGSWQNGPTGYAYLWSRCDSTGASCAATGVAASTYSLSAGDVGHTLRVNVTASNSAGSSGAISAPTAVVTQAPVGATLGSATIGSRSDTFAADHKRVNGYTLSTSGSLSKLSIYLQPTTTTGTQTIQGIVYADAGGSPGALVATTVALTFSSSQAAGWYDLTFAQPLGLAPGTYWLGVITGTRASVIGFRWTPATGARVWNANIYTAGPSSSFGSGTFDNEQMSLYATYTPN